MKKQIEKIKKVKENKILRGIYLTVYYTLFIFIFLVLLVVVLQRLSNNNKSLAGFRVFNVITQSMVPEYKVGDILIAKETDINTIEIDDDVVYIGEKGTFKEKIVTHRVIEKKQNEDGTYSFVTKGLANPDADPEITGGQIYGVVVYKMKFLTYINKLVGNLKSLYFAIFVPITILVFFEFRSNILKNKKEKNEVTEEKDEDSKTDN